MYNITWGGELSTKENNANGIMYYSLYKSPVGQLTIASDGENITGLWIEGQKYFGSTLSSEKALEKDMAVLKQAVDWLERYFAGEKPLPSELPLDPQGSEFRQAVWDVLCEISYGEVITYGDIAKRIAAMKGIETMSAQAVGGAVGHNPISIIIPCHRVVGSDGSLTGYAGGIERKKWLLAHEGLDMSKFYVPIKGTAL